MSDRTLFRRLAQEGRSFHGVLQKAGRTLAEEPLKREDPTIAEIAFITGFHELSTFSRALKRWVGVPPATYRRSPRPV